MAAVPARISRNLGLRPADLRDPYLRKLQRRYDALALYPRVYPLEAAGHKKSHSLVAHVGHHVVKAGLKLAEALDATGDAIDDAEEVVRREAMPEAVMDRTRLANILNVDLARILETHPRSVQFLATYAFESAQHELAIASGTIAAFIEPLEEGHFSAAMRKRLIELGIPALHSAGLMLAQHFGEDPTEAHATRLLSLIAQGQPHLLQ